MEDILILKDSKGGTAVLTTDSPISHYGIPTLRIEAEDVDGDFGPSDLIGEIPRVITAASIIAAWATQSGRTEAELKAADSYLRQWPEGPQIPKREAARTMGKMTSPKKARSSAENGKRGGRPRKPQK